MSFIQKIRTRLGIGGKSPIDDQRKKRIEAIAERSVQNWKPEYDNAYQEVVKEWSTEGKEITHKAVDKEAKKRAAVEDLKLNVSEEAKAELMPEIRQELPEEERARKIGEKGAEKGIEKTVDKTVDKLVDKISKEKEEEEASTEEEPSETEKPPAVEEE
ncbi:MAG: hypothetical protein ACXACI_19895 [Candidatus Hodarchaeales archaeon]|jgi:hypothetical protein